MLVGRSQLNENLQGDFSIIQQISALRRENRFLKVGLVFCLILSAMPYLTGFQPETISAKRVVTERIEFVSDGKTVFSLVVHPNKLGLVIEDRNAKGLVLLGTSLLGGLVSVYNRNGLPVAHMASLLWGGSLSVMNDNNKRVAGIDALPNGGGVYVGNNDARTVASIGVLPDGGAIYVRNNDENRVIGLEATKHGGMISVSTNDETTVAQMRSDRDGCVIAVGDKKGRAIWSAP
jgi:hypothetical protein